MKVEALRESQKAAGMVQDKDPEKHLKSGCTMLPPPDGPEAPYVCMVKTHSPIANVTILGVTFMSKKFENVDAGEGGPPQQRYITHTVNLTPNQFAALKIKIAQERVTGFTGRVVKDHATGREINERVEDAPLANYIVLEPFKDSDQVSSELASILAKNEAQSREIEDLKRKLAEQEAAADAGRASVRAAVPSPRK